MELSMERPHPSPSGKGTALLQQVASEAKKQVRLAVPLIVGCLLQNVIQMISVMFVGHLGELALASASMATSFAIVTGFSFLTGMSCSLETLCGQAFGASQDHMLGVYTQRAMVVLGLASVPIAAVWANTGWILLRLGQDPEIAAGAGLYIRWMLPSLLFYGWLQCHVRFLQTQKIVVPMMVSSGVTAAIHVLVCWALVYKLGMGIKGAAVANAISFLVNVSILALYVRFSPSCKTTWTGFSCEAFHDIPAFLKLAVPSAMMVCMEWWSFEVMVLLGGLLPNPKLSTAVLSICLNTNSIVCTVPNGLSSSISTRVSNELGAGRPRAALLAARVVMLLAFLVGTSEGILLILVRNLLGLAYSKDQEVVAYVAKMMFILAPSVLFDGLQYVLSGRHFVVSEILHVTQIGRDLQALLGAADDKRLVLSSTSLHTISLVFLQRLFSPSSVIWAYWGFGWEYSSEWSHRCCCFSSFPLAPTIGKNKQSMQRTEFSLHRQQSHDQRHHITSTRLHVCYIV